MRERGRVTFVTAAELGVVGGSETGLRRIASLGLGLGLAHAVAILDGAPRRRGGWFIDSWNSLKDGEETLTRDVYITMKISAN